MATGRMFQIHPPSHPSPVKPQEALKIYKGQLSEYEMTEIGMLPL